MKIKYEKMHRFLNAASQSGVKSNVRSQNVGVLKTPVFFLLVNRVWVQTVNCLFPNTNASGGKHMMAMQL